MRALIQSKSTCQEMERARRGRGEEDETRLVMPKNMQIVAVATQRGNIRNACSELWKTHTPCFLLPALSPFAAARYKLFIYQYCCNKIKNNICIELIKIAWGTCHMCKNWRCNILAASSKLCLHRLCVCEGVCERGRGGQRGKEGVVYKTCAYQIAESWQHFKWIWSAFYCRKLN